MEKAYSIKALGGKIAEKAKAEGLPIAEEALEKLGKSVYLGFKEWSKESAALSENKIDDFAAPFLDNLDHIVLPQIEKIDLNGDGK